MCTTQHLTVQHKVAGTQERCTHILEFISSLSVHFLHLRSLIGCAFYLLEWRQVIVVAKALIVVINAQTQLDHTVDTTSKLCGLIEVEAGGEERCVKQEPNEIFHSLVRLVSC